jgi:hypothetical protein
VLKNKSALELEFLVIATTQAFLLLSVLPQLLNSLQIAK